MNTPYKGLVLLSVLSLPVVALAEEPVELEVIHVTASPDKDGSAPLQPVEVMNEEDLKRAQASSLGELQPDGRDRFLPPPHGPG